MWGPHCVRALHVALGRGTPPCQRGRTVPHPACPHTHLARGLGWWGGGWGGGTPAAFDRVDMQPVGGSFPSHLGRRWSLVVSLQHKCPLVRLPFGSMAPSFASACLAVVSFVLLEGPGVLFSSTRCLGQRGKKSSAFSGHWFSWLLHASSFPPQGSASSTPSSPRSKRPGQPGESFGFSVCLPLPTRPPLPSLLGSGEEQERAVLLSSWHGPHNTPSLSSHLPAAGG